MDQLKNRAILVQFIGILSKHPVMPLLKRYCIVYRRMAQAYVVHIQLFDRLLQFVLGLLANGKNPEIPVSRVMVRTGRTDRERRALQDHEGLCADRRRTKKSFLRGA